MSSGGIMTKLGIRFHDNDFGMTFVQALTLLLKVYRESPASFEDITKQDVFKFINELLITSYYFQNLANNYRDNHDHREYLKIKEKDLYFDDEIQAYLNEEDQWLNGEFFWIDFETETIYIDNMTLEQAFA
jgi:hypothetical protein